MIAGTEAFLTVPNHDSHLHWWKNAGLRNLNLLLCTVFIAQTLNGYDSSLISGFQSMASWKKALGEPNSSDIGLLNAATYLAGMLTAPVAAYVADRWGRRWCIRYSSVTNLIGTAIGAASGAGSSNGYAAFIMSRIIIGSGLAFALMTSPVILQELPHPRHRTWMAGFFDVAFIIGNFIAAWVLFGCSHITSNWAWRVPYLIHLGPALAMIVLITFVPESPRWLIKQGRHEEAKAFFTKYHANGHENDQLAEFEYNEIIDAIDFEAKAHQDTWKTILTTRSSLHRLGCVILIAVCQGLSGTGIIQYYYTTILKLVGITDSTTQTGINAGLTSFTAIMALFGLWLTQHIRRRPQIFISWTGVLCANIGLTVATALYSKGGNTAAGIAAVVFVWLYNGTFFIACGPIFFSYPAEILHYSMRAKGMMIWAITAKVLSVFSSYVNSIAMANIGWKWYLFYLCIIVVTFVLVYFFIVETKGYTLEEISEAFEGRPLTTVDAYTEELKKEKNSSTDGSLVDKK